MEAFAAAGGEVKELQDRGDPVGVAWLWEAFLELSSCRSFGMGVIGAIPWTAIQRYIEVHEFDEAEAYAVRMVVRHLDMVYREHTVNDEKAKSSMKSPIERIGSYRGRKM